MWSELKGTAQAFGMNALRMTLLYRSESDSISIQRNHGDWANGAVATGSFDVKANQAGAKVEFRSATDVAAFTVDGMKQAAECACGRIFGKASEVRGVPRREEAAAE